MLDVRVTEHPTGGWIIQQPREAFAYDAVPRHLAFDNDKKYGTDVLAVIEHMGIRCKQIIPYSPWQTVWLHDGSQPYGEIFSSR